MNELKAKFASLTDREKLLVTISAVVMLVAIFFFAIWQPLNKGIELEKAKLKNQQSLLAWVEKQSQRAILLRGSGSSSSTFRGSLPQAVNNTTSRHNIAVSRMQPQGEELQVWIDEASFNDLLSWLQALENMGVLIQQVDITDTDKSGYIKVRRLQLGKP